VRDSLDSFEALYRTHYRRVRQLVLSFRLPSGATDDVIQDVFVAAWRSLGTLKEPAAFGGWLQMIARNRCLLELRRSRPTVGIAADEGAEEDRGAEVVLVADDHLASFHWESSVALVREIVAAQRGEPRASIARLFYLDKVPVREIAERLGLKQNTVLSHLRRFRHSVSSTLADLLDEHGIELS
jgi:RNA polymerase sigma-70 factor (ECF subfamily)